jgi:beta-glucanase (GH16 family)
MQDKTSFSNGVMTIRMEGDSGARLYYPLALQYGLIEVTAKVSGVSGVVSAFYVSGSVGE